MRCRDCASGRTTSSPRTDRKSTRLNSSHLVISYAVFCLKKKNTPLVLPRCSPREGSDQPPYPLILPPRLAGEGFSLRRGPRIVFHCPAAWYVFLLSRPVC